MKVLILGLHGNCAMRKIQQADLPPISVVIVSHTEGSMAVNNIFVCFSCRYVISSPFRSKGVQIKFFEIWTEGRRPRAFRDESEGAAFVRCNRRHLLS
ncbi:hypothetical protein TNCV_2411261 [Trichonephila clavipes]|nr:hypothetical protein TNCV_2411261 [Trichonephila clavipes]